MIFEKLNKANLFYKFIIPFNWIQSFQAIIMLTFAIFGLFLPPSIFVFWLLLVVFGNIFFMENW